MDVLSHNRAAWDRNVVNQNRWTVPVSAEEVARARQGDWRIVLTPTKPVPRAWFPPLTGLDCLCLASGGGQQGPILAAAGANVTVFDNSPRQLGQDRLVAERECLSIATVQGDMADLSAFSDASFGLIFHPCSNCFAQHVRPMWAEASRVLRPQGVLLAGFTNPVRYVFDPELAKQGELLARFPLPYSDLESLSESERRRWVGEGEPFEFGHTLEDQIGGQLDAGLVLTGFYEDRWDADTNDPISRFLATYIATRAVKLF